MTNLNRKYSAWVHLFLGRDLDQRKVASLRDKSGPGDVVMGIPGSGKSRKTPQCKVVGAGGVL